MGRYKTWTLDSGQDYGLDHGLDYGVDYGLNIGLDFGLNSKLISCFETFQAFTLSSF